MEYISSRGNFKNVKSAEAMTLGMVPKGGLFMPNEIPKVDLKEILKLEKDNYQQLAQIIIEKFLTDFKSKEIKAAVKAAYNKESFKEKDKTPLVKLNNNSYVLELWHGPTAAFKDLALQILPHLLIESAEKLKIDKEIVILVATSGDTGKAALEGFKNVEGFKIIVFYPEAGVSKIQEDQMKTTAGDNTEVAAVSGNFDDCQTAVKKLFSDQKFKDEMEKEGYLFSSANSINWGRLLPQIIYYFKAYLELVTENEIKAGKKINISVPTGNFGNIFAAYYAQQMGLPVNKFICASNDNKILTDFLNTGIYDANREFIKTISPAMDILISSNLERFLFEITDHNSDKINDWYTELKDDNKFKIDKKTLNKIQDLFVGEYASEAEVKKTINNIYQKFNYLIDPHTAVAVNALVKYRTKSGDQTPAVIASTANPYKFSQAVLESITESEIEKDEYRVIEELKKITAKKIHRGVKDLEKLEYRHHHHCNKDEIKSKIIEILA